MRILWIAVAIILADQASKYTVVQTMYRGQSIPVIGDWLRLTFTENPGMAFGIMFGPTGLITILAIGATALIVLYLVKTRDGYFPYRASLAFILGGALGNIIDRVFYGYLLDYDGFFAGKVVDFIHVNLWRGYIPEVIPFLGGNYVALFPIWNVADMAIVCGFVGILVFQRKFHYQERLKVRRRRQEAAKASEVSDTAGTDGTPRPAPANESNAPDRSDHSDHPEGAGGAAADDRTDAAGRTDAADQTDAADSSDLGSKEGRVHGI